MTLNFGGIPPKLLTAYASWKHFLIPVTHPGKPSVRVTTTTQFNAYSFSAAILCVLVCCFLRATSSVCVCVVVCMCDVGAACVYR